MYRQEGVQGLMKGNLINCISNAPFTALEFFFYEFYKNNLYHDIDYCSLEYKHKFICGGLAGMSAQLMIYPLDVIKTHLTVQQNTT